MRTERPMKPLVIRCPRHFPGGHHPERGVTMILVAVAMVAIIGLAIMSLGALLHESFPFRGSRKPRLPQRTLAHGRTSAARQEQPLRLLRRWEGKAQWGAAHQPSLFNTR